MKRLIRKVRFKKIESLIYINRPNNPTETAVLKYTLRTFNKSEKTGFQQIDKRSYHKAYAVFKGDKLVHVSFVFKKNLLGNQLGFKSAYTIGECITNEAYRGQGIYPSTLKIIKRDFFDNTLIVFVHPANTASIKGIEKAGFTKLYEFTMYRFFGINLYTKKVNQ